MGDQPTLSCPFKLSVEQVNALSAEQAHDIILRTKPDQWCLLHKIAYGDIRKLRALIGKELVLSIVENVPRCGGIEALFGGK